MFVTARCLHSRYLVAFLAASVSPCHASIFSGAAPVAPANAPGDPQLILTSVDVQGPIGMEVREDYDFFLEGTFYNSGTSLLEDYTMNTVDWAVTESSSPADGLSIDSDGAFEAKAYPSIEYPRDVSIDAVTTEGAPLDSESQPIEYSDSQTVEITRQSSDLDFAEWIAAETTLTGDDALETADPDEDGKNNLLEFALDTSPQKHTLLSGFSHAYDSSEEASTFTLTLPKDRDEVVYTVETTSDLSVSEPVWTPQELTFVSDDGDTETWRIEVSGGDTLFGRLSIETYTP